MQNIKTSSFSLSKGKNLTGDDFSIFKTIDNITIGIVCDGVGSAMYGNIAAKRVAEYLINNFKSKPSTWSIQKSIDKFIKSINSILYLESIQNYERVELVTTLSIVVINGDRLYGANVGDSRVYLQRENTLTQLSQDHTMSEAGYQNVLTAAIGLEESVVPYYFENIINKNDKILLCSDGLYNVMSEEQITSLIPTGAYNLVKKASTLHEDNLPDDTTALILDIIDVDPKLKLKLSKVMIPDTLKKGEIIDGYKLLKSLIPNNRTWLVEKSNLKYVMKFAPVEAIESETHLDLFINEAWNAKRLKAGFFPKAVIPKNRTMRYYIMQYLEGITLKEYIAKKRLTVDDSVNLAKTLLNMSQFLLKFDLVHGDIKPENIMITKRGDKKVFKIIDFGSITEIFSINNRAGTPSYLAPERFLESSINESSEIFSIGVTLYEALTQKFPYGEIEPFQNPKFKQAQKPSIFNKNIPEWLDAVILKSIAIETDQRYTNYSNMVYELNNTTKVKPFFDKNTPLIEREPLKFYKYGFYILLVLNIVLLINS